MCLRTRITTCLILLLFGALANGQTPMKDPAAARAGEEKRSTIRGRVIYDDSGKPLRRVRVMLYDPATRQGGRPLMSWTDGRGNFKIGNVPAGKYFVNVEAPGIVNEWARPSDQTNQPSVAVDGNSDGEIIVRAKRGGAISGKVTYADGEPARNTAIQILIRQDGRWAMAFYGGGQYGSQCQIDERGNYRVYGLAPGEYIVAAAEMKNGVEAAAPNDPEGGNYVTSSTLATTYYNGTSNLAAANLVSVSAGNEEKDINITIPERTFRNVAGIILLRPDSVPVQRARVSLKRQGDAGRYGDEAAVTSTDEQGRFTLDEVPDGIYTLVVTPPQAPGRNPYGPPTPPDPTRKFVSRNVEVNVAGADIPDIVVEVSYGSRISGNVVVDGGKPLPRDVAVHAEPLESKSSESGVAVLAQPDGSFILDGVPAGFVLLRISVSSANTYYTKAVTVGKTDLARGPLQLKEGEDVRNVRIIVSSDVAKLSGRVVSGTNRTPVADWGLLFLPADSEQHKTVTGRMMSMTNANGQFQASGAPGEYLVLMFRRSQFPSELTYEALRSRLSAAQRVVLLPGENTIDLVAPEEK